MSKLDKSEVVKYGLLERMEFFSIYFVKDKGYCVMDNYPHHEFESAYLNYNLLGNGEFNFVTDNLSEAKSYIQTQTNLLRKMNKSGFSMSSLRCDAEAEDFVANADLTQYDLSKFKPIRFEITLKSSVINVRLPSPLLHALKQKAESKGITYTCYVRMLLEADLMDS